MFKQVRWVVNPAARDKVAPPMVRSYCSNLRVYLRQPKDIFTPSSKGVTKAEEVVFTWLQDLVKYL